MKTSTLFFLTAILLYVLIETNGSENGSYLVKKKRQTGIQKKKYSSSESLNVIEILFFVI